MKMELFIARLIGMVGNEAAHQTYQTIGQRQCDQGGADIEHGMEHSQLHLRCVWKHSLKHPSEPPIPLGEKMKKQGDEQE